MADTIYIRADSSPQRGMGHVVRMTVLAEALRSTGFRVVFLSRSLEGLGGALVEEAGFPARILASSPGPGGNLTSEDAAEVSALLRGGCAGLVVDHYGVTPGYLEAVGRDTRMLACIDDLASRRYPVDLVVNGNLGAETFQIDARPGARVVAGAAYAMLRSQFARERERGSSGSPRPARVLLIFGGSDPQRQTGRFVRLLRAEAQRRKVEIHAVVGPGVELPEQLASGAFIHSDIRDVAELFSGMSFAFTAGGTTVLELGCLGIPAAIVVVAQDQTRAAEQGERSGAFLNLGWFARISDGEIRESFRRFVEDERQLVEMSQKGRDLVDGKGAARVAGEIRTLFDGRAGR